MRKKTSDNWIHFSIWKKFLIPGCAEKKLKHIKLKSSLFIINPYNSCCGIKNGSEEANELPWVSKVSWFFNRHFLSFFGWECFSSWANITFLDRYPLEQILQRYKFSRRVWSQEYHNFCKENFESSYMMSKMTSVSWAIFEFLGTDLTAVRVFTSLPEKRKCL